MDTIQPSGTKTIGQRKICYLVFRLKDTAGQWQSRVSQVAQVLAEFDLFVLAQTTREIMHSNDVQCNSIESD